MKRFTLWAIALMFATQLSTLPAVADDFFWVGAANGNFPDPLRWSPAGGPPNAGDAALFSVGGTYTVSGGGTVTIFQVGGGDVTFTGGISTDSQSPGNALFFAGGTARVSGSISSPLSMEIGQNKNGGAGNGTLRVISGGQVQSNAVVSLNDVAVSMAGQATSTATLIIENTNSRLTANGGLNIAGAGTANVQVLAGGELATSGHLPTSTPGIKIAVEAGGTGTLLVDGTAARVNNTLQMNIGQLGHGTFTVQNGGQINTSGNATLPAMVMAFGAGSTGIGYVEAAGSLTTNGQFVIGGAGTAEFYLQPGGTVTSNAIGTAAAVFVANGATADAIARVNGGTWDVNGDFFLGGQGHGQVRVESGATLDIANANSLLTIGFQDGGLGEMFVNGGQLLRPNTNTAITVGIGGRGRMEIHNGSDVADSRLRIAQIATSAVDPSEVIVEGVGSTLSIKDELDVGMEDHGQLRIQNGAIASVTAATSFAQAGAGATGHGEFIVTGTDSLLDVAGTMILGRAGRGDLGIGDNGSVDSRAATLGLLANSEGNASIDTGGAWNVDGDLVVGDHGTGFLYIYQDGSISLATGQRIYLGQSADGTGTLNLYGNGQLNVDIDVIVGHNGTGIFNLREGATHTTLAPGPYLLGNLEGSRGEVHVDTGSTFTVSGDVIVGVGGEGSVTVDPTSTLDVSNGTLVIGLGGGSLGEVIVNGGQLLRQVGGFTTIGFLGRGRLEVQNGATVSDDSIRIAQQPSASNDASELVVNGAGTSLTLTGSLDVGIEDLGTATVSGGAQLSVGTGLVASGGATGEGNVLVTGAGSKLTVTGPAILGEAGRSFSGVETGGTLETGQGTLGRLAGSEGNIDVSSGGTWNVHGNLIVGDLGVGFVYLRPGGTIAVDAGSQVILGNQTGSSGVLNIYEDGALNIDSDVVIGLAGAGALNLNDGAIYNSFGNIALGAIAGASGHISVNSVAAFYVHGDLTIAEDFEASGGVTVNGDYALLSATNMYVGGSTVEAGGLAVVNVTGHGLVLVANRLHVWGGGSVNANGGGVTISSGPIAADGEVRVYPLGTLSGSGVINGHVINAGTLAPGDSPGTLTINGDYFQWVTGELEIEIGGTAPGIDHDQLVVAGAVQLSGALQVNLLPGFTPEPGDVFQILTVGSSISLDFLSAVLPSLTGANWQLIYAANSVSLRVAITGDYNRNGTVDAADYTVWRNSLNQSGVALAADGNRDGTITRLDFDVWKSQFGMSAGSGTNIVPEPSIVVLLLSLALIHAARRRSFSSPRHLF